MRIVKVRIDEEELEETLYIMWNSFVDDKFVPPLRVQQQHACQPNPPQQRVLPVEVTNAGLLASCCVERS